MGVPMDDLTRYIFQYYDRLLTAAVVLNRSPKCDGLCRTPRARQCARCMHSWRGTSRT
jgi:hypothetical protein